MHWEALKQMVYAKNWLAKNSDQEKSKNMPKKWIPKSMCKCLKISVKN